MGTVVKDANQEQEKQEKIALLEFRETVVQAKLYLINFNKDLVMQCLNAPEIVEQLHAHTKTFIGIVHLISDYICKIAPGRKNTSESLKDHNLIMFIDYLKKICHDNNYSNFNSYDVQSIFSQTFSAFEQFKLYIGRLLNPIGENEQINSELSILRDEIFVGFESLRSLCSDSKYALTQYSIKNISPNVPLQRYNQKLMNDIEKNLNGEEKVRSSADTSIFSRLADSLFGP